MESYVFQSGKYQGKTTAEIMFKDYPYLMYLFQIKQAALKPNSKKDKLLQNLEWLLQQGENRPVPTLCPQCDPKSRKKPIASILPFGDNKQGYLMGIRYSCCQEETCIKKLCKTEEERRRLIPIKFSYIRKFDKKSHQQQFVRVLKNIFQLNGKITPKKALEFFSS